MNKDKLLKLYLKDLNPPVNINGLFLHPQLTDDTIKWKVENPNDISYSNSVVEGHLEELFYNFKVTTGTKDRPEWGTDDYTKYCRIGRADYFYINQELRDKINDKCNDFKTITLDDDGQELISDCYVLNWDIGYENNEVLNVFISLELTNPKINGEDVDDDTLEQFIKDFIYNDTASEQEMDVIWDITKLIVNDKNMFDGIYMYSNPVIGYFDRFGNGLT